MTLRITLHRIVAAVAVVAWPLAAAPAARAAETDNFTCRARLTIDAQPMLDDWIDSGIMRALAHANARAGACDASCLRRLLRKEVGGSVPSAWTLIPRSRLGWWIEHRSAVPRCQLPFKASVYGVRPYNQPWLLPFTRRVIVLADSLLLAGHVVGVDKLDHFIREGRAHRDDFTRGRPLDAILGAELGRAARPLAMTEHGLKGLRLTGVLAYADLAASYSGFWFWTHLEELDTPLSYIGYDAASRRYVVRRRFSFASYVNASWDEAINRSRLVGRLHREVTRRRQALGGEDLQDCRLLGMLPDARLYVNPDCLSASLPQPSASGWNCSCAWEPWRRPGALPTSRSQLPACGSSPSCPIRS